MSAAISGTPETASASRSGSRDKPYPLSRNPSTLDSPRTGRGSVWNLNEAGRAPSWNLNEGGGPPSRGPSDDGPDPYGGGGGGYSGGGLGGGGGGYGGAQGRPPVPRKTVTQVARHSDVKYRGPDDASDDDDALADQVCDDAFSVMTPW